jgi:hypothetical protein
MANAFNKYNIFVDDLAKAGHNLSTAVFKVALTNTAPTPATDTIWSAGVYPPPAAANGYTTGGNTITTTSGTTTGGIYKLILVDTVFTAAGGNLGPFRYAVLYDSSATNKVVGYYDYGSSITLADTETFTVDFDGTNGVLTLQ